MVTGSKIPVELKDSYVLRNISNPQNGIRGDHIALLDKEVEKLLQLGVAQKTTHEEGEVISPVFLVPKSDGTSRMILNLNNCNQSVGYQHFKMENVSSATNMMKRDCCMASVDLRHAYYSVPIAQKDIKYLKFQWRGQLFQYTCFANGLCNCPWYFTKLMKPVFAHMRAR